METVWEMLMPSDGLNEYIILYGAYTLALLVIGMIGWRLRGGAFGYLCRHGKTKYEVIDVTEWFTFKGFWPGLRDGFEPGDTVTRMVSAMLMASACYPMFNHGWVVPLIGLSMFSSMVIGYFNGASGMEKPNDIWWMMLWGFTVTYIGSLAIALVGLFLSPHAPFFASLPGLIGGAVLLGVIGSLAGPVYKIRHLQRNNPKWQLPKNLWWLIYPDSWTEYAEFTFGAVVMGCWLLMIRIMVVFFGL